MEIRTSEMLTDVQKRQIVEQIKEHLKAYTHTDFARKMGITPQNAYAWVNRGAYNAELVAVKCPEISGDWLLTGKGPMLKADRVECVPETPAGATQVTDCKDELKKLVDALEEEQKLTANAQAQADKLIGLLQSITAFYDRSSNK